MATITIKIESEQLAREVLTQLGYLPGDVPDLVSVESEEDVLTVVDPELPRSCSTFRPKYVETFPESTRNIPVPKQSEFCMGVAAVASIFGYHEGYMKGFEEGKRLAEIKPQVEGGPR